MKRQNLYLVIAILLLNVSLGYAQLPCSFNNILFQPIKANQVSQVENKWGSRLEEHHFYAGIILSDDYYPDVDKHRITEHPLVFDRPESDGIYDHIEYFYSLPDSLVRCVIYDWITSDKISEKRLYPKILRKNDCFKKIYTQKLGAPKISHKYVHTSKFEWYWKNEVIESNRSIPEA